MNRIPPVPGYGGPETASTTARLPLPGERGDCAPVDEAAMPAMRSLIAALIAAISGFAVVRTGGAMMRNGVDLQEGGGWAAIVITEVCVSFAAVAVALS